jgi:hypothetical protein
MGTSWSRDPLGFQQSVHIRWEESCSLPVISCFLFLNFIGTRVSQERQHYQDMPRVRDSDSFSFQDFSFRLMTSVSMSASSSWCGIGRRSVWASFWRGARACAPGYHSWSVQARGLNSAANHASGVFGGFKRWRWSACSIVLACPCWSLEGLLFATQENLFEKELACC